MKSEQLPLNDIPNEQKLTMSKAMLAHGAEKVQKNVDELTSSSLKRVLKVICHVHLADELLEKKVDISLNEKEQMLIDNIFALQETVFGHQALVHEIEKGTGLDNNTNIETTLEITNE